MAFHCFFFFFHLSIKKLYDFIFNLHTYLLHKYLENSLAFFLSYCTLSQDVLASDPYHSNVSHALKGFLTLTRNISGEVKNNFASFKKKLLPDCFDQCPVYLTFPCSSHCINFLPFRDFHESGWTTHQCQQPSLMTCSMADHNDLMHHTLFHN